MRRVVLCIARVATLAVLAAAPVLAQDARQPSDTLPDDTLRFRVEPIVVTATRTPRALFVTPKPVSVVTRSLLRERTLNTVSDLFTELPGVDITGVGVNQVRPTIRGQRGQRILLLSDGLRLNNARRQQDFGEIPGLIDVASVDRVEVVRGPSSVLYGTDAIGGVVNIITRAPEAEGVHGFARYAWGSQGQHTVSARSYGRLGRIDLQVGASFRTADPYEAPDGEFGAIELAEPAVVHDTGIDDRSFEARIGYRLDDDASVFLEHERYSAEDAGFGYVAAEDYAPDQGLVRIRYPDQSWHRTTAGLRARELGSLLADRFELTAYYQGNERSLAMNIQQAIGPGALLDIASDNYTDIRTVGFRAEAARLAVPGVLLTYGIDLFRDDSDNTDASVTTITGFGPPIVETSDEPQLPNATYRSAGIFAQAELEPTDRITLVVGVRAQDVHAETETAPAGEDGPVSENDRTVVGSANLAYRVSDALALVGSIGRGFRSPNLIEMFFQGPTPEGSGYQLRNPDLEAETSLNIDLGARVRYGPARLEAFGTTSTGGSGSHPVTTKSTASRPTGTSTWTSSATKASSSPPRSSCRRGSGPRGRTPPTRRRTGPIPRARSGRRSRPGSPAACGGTPPATGCGPSTWSGIRASRMSWPSRTTPSARPSRPSPSTRSGAAWCSSGAFGARRPASWWRWRTSPTPSTPRRPTAPSSAPSPAVF
jgi:outer membrane receptor protein involved in Fe transport